MKDAKTENVKKKGILAAIWDSIRDSMTKTGGCCGSGGNCCGPAKPQASKDGAGSKPSGQESGRADKKR